MPSSGSLETVLVVDDAPENIDVLSGILRPHYKVKAATNGDKALALAMSERPPDLILLDIMMPGMSGFDVCKALKAHMPTRHIPVIFVTAMGETEDETRGFELGCVDYITKPVSPPIVLARVKTHLALQDQNRVLERLVTQRTQQLAETQQAIIRCLGKAAEYKDDQTGMHVLRMSHYCRILGIAVGMSENDADLLQQAAPMHDVGKIGTPDHILKKPGKLDPEEWKIMQQHVEHGGEILGEHNSELLQMARLIALNHHEKWDGSGYPRGLSGRDIPLVARIAAVADVFDALTSVRPYKNAWSVQEALTHMREQAGKMFEPLLIDKLEENIAAVEAVRHRYGDPTPAEASHA